MARTGQEAKRNYDKRSKIGTKAALKKGAANAAVVAINLIPTGRAASTVGKIVSRTTAKKMVPGESKEVVRKFTQGKNANIVEQAPKKYKEGAKSPVKGTKVTVVKKTKAQTPLQVTTVTKGRIARENTKKAGTYAKGAVTGAYVMNEIDKAKAKKKSK
jgi:hypothetical protein